MRRLLNTTNPCSLSNLYKKFDQVKSFHAAACSLHIYSYVQKNIDCK
jgi:hypothetical protein